MKEIKKLDVTAKESLTRKAKLKEKLKKLPDKKPHLDFIAAILSIPVLLTVLTLNILSLQNKTAKPTPTPDPTSIQAPTVQERRIRTITPIVISTTPIPTTDPAQCTKAISPISIDSPSEGQVISDNPVCITINPNQGNYCSSVWAYKVNNSALSDYANNSVCLYNLPTGQNTFELDVKSLVTQATTTLIRRFVYQPTTTPTPTLMPTNTPTMTPTVMPSAQ